MIKMPCLFVRTFHGKRSFTLTNTVTPGCEWVLAGEGTASRKRDGTACLFKSSQLWKRFDAKKDRKTGEFRLPPDGSIPCDNPDPVTGHWPHWAPLDPYDYWHHEAFARQAGELVEGATYELCGPKINANPECFEVHTLIRHGAEVWNVYRSYDELRAKLEQLPWEGIVFAHPDGRFAKIRRHDFGLQWPPPKGGDP